MADQEAERSQQIAGTAPTISRANAIVALAVCFVAGYFLAEWGAPKTRDRSPIAQISARVHYVNSLQENLQGQKLQVRKSGMSSRHWSSSVASLSVIAHRKMTEAPGVIAQAAAGARLARLFLGWIL